MITLNGDGTQDVHFGGGKLQSGQQAVIFEGGEDVHHWGLGNS